MNEGRPDHMKGLEFNRALFFEVIEPILDREFPDLSYAAGLIGVGSEVLGYDDSTSTDHHWGPRGMLFLPADLHEKRGKEVWDCLANELPYSFNGYATHFTPPDPKTGKSWTREEIDKGPVNHLVHVGSLEAFSEHYLGIKPDDPLPPEVWLSLPGQLLRTFTGGDVFRDDPGGLTELRKKLTYYPDQVWLYLLAAAWARIGQEEAFLGRTGIRDDELGSRLVSARLVHDMMNLCFLIEQVYPPYSKWFGTAFKELECADKLLPIFLSVLAGDNWQKRQEAIIPAYEFVAEYFNQLGLVDPIPVKTSQFFGRPFQVIWGDVPAQRLVEKIQDPAVKTIANQTMIGSVEQFSTSTDLLCKTDMLVKIRNIYL